MSTDHHTPHAYGAPLTSAGINAPLAELDAAITALDPFDVRVFGATGDGSTDDTAAIQAAIDAADAATGGVVYLPTGTYKITSSLIIASVYGIGLVGPIGTGWQPMGAANGGAILNWAGGAAPMLIIRPAVDGGNWPANNVRVENLALQGNDLATQCIHIEALKLGVFKNLNLFKTTDAALYVGSTSVSGYIGNQHTYNCTFENISIDQWHGAGAGRGVSAGTTAVDARMFFCSFTNINIKSVVVALDLIAVDHCTFDNMSIASTGTYSVVFEGQSVNYNIFVNLWPGTGGLQAKGTTDGTGGPSVYNTVFGYSLSDAAPMPTISYGALLTCYFDTGRPTPIKRLRHASNGANANYYTKVATGSLPVQFAQQSGAFEASTYAGSSGYLAHVDFRVYQASTINGANQPVVNLLVQQKLGWVAADFSIVVTNVTTTIDWELWVKMPGTNAYIEVAPQIDAPGSIDWLETQTPAAAVSAGTATAGTSV